MPNISNLTVYNQRMRDAMADKLWWTEMTDAKVVVDYGCADGALLQILEKEHPDWILIGVDHNQQMLSLARKNLPSAIFYTPEDFFSIQLNFDNAVLVLSSVIHEIFEYDNNPADTLEKLFNMGFGYIAIRDMFLSMNSYKSCALIDLDRIRNKANIEQLKQFERKWGSVSDQRNFLHYLMKYRYVENWDRELNENYFPVCKEDFLKIHVTKDYQIEYLKHYTLPYISDRVYQDFEIELKDPTHMKLLLKRNPSNRWKY